MDTHALDCLYKVTSKTAEHSLSYTVHIKKENNHFILQVQDILIDEKAPDTLADELAFSCGSVLYPLSLSVSQEGEMTKIVNHAEILNRWNHLKEQLDLYYKDEYSLNYIQEQNKLYNSPSLLYYKLKDSPFFHAYFGGIYTKSFGDDFYREYQQEIKGTYFLCSQSVDTETDENDLFSVWVEADQAERKENIQTHYILNNIDKNPEKMTSVYTQNGEWIQEVQIEKIEPKIPFQPSQREEETGEEKRQTEEKPLPGSSHPFWIDERK